MQIIQFTIIQSLNNKYGDVAKTQVKYLWKE